MTVLSRGARSRRSGRRPGWTLLTALLVLAIVASSALVFTSRTELLKLAVVLALWAAVVAAFVSVIYRRQSDIDQAKARDLKLVYDLQLDREIAARREYELEVESQLRRELTAELQAEAADEVAALRAELAALRNNLEILFEADLAERPAIETERTTVRAYSDWARDDETTDPGRRQASFTASARGRVVAADEHDEDHIIDVHEEPAEPEDPLAQRPSGLYVPPSYGGTHRRPSEEGPWAPAAPQPGYQPPERPSAREEWLPSTTSAGDLQQAAGQRVAPGTPSSDWLSPGNGYGARGPVEPAAAEPPRGRHSTSAEPGVGGPPPAAPTAQAQYGVTDAGRRARHSAEDGDYATPQSTVAPPPSSPPPPGPAPRHGTAASDERDRQHGEGHGPSVADLLARLQQNGGSQGGRRRRRDD